MSIKLMSAIFDTEFRDLTDEPGNVTKASTAKLVMLALADHANDEGEGAYPGLTRMERKTSLSRQTIINTYDALKYNGIIYLAGISKRNTNKYSINVKSLPKMQDGEAILLVKPLDQSNELTSTSQVALLEVVNPLDPNHHITIQETPSEDVSKHTAYQRGEQERPDKVSEWLGLVNAPGMKQQARIDALLSAYGEAFTVNSENSDFKKLAKHAISEQTLKGWNPAVFIEWVKRQKGFAEGFWSARRMLTEYPKAYMPVNLPDEEKTRLL